MRAEKIGAWHRRLHDPLTGLWYHRGPSDDAGTVEFLGLIIKPKK